MGFEIQERKDEKRIYLKNPELEDIMEAVAALEEEMGYNKRFPRQKIKVKFSETINLGLYQRVEKVNETDLNFLVSANGHFCYTTRRDVCWELKPEIFSKIFCMSIGLESKIKKNPGSIDKYFKKFHPNAWHDLRNKRQVIPEMMSLTYIKSKFPPNVIKNLEEAFKNKTSYKHTEYGQKRNLIVETEMCWDGIFRAWYASEETIGWKGHYYILINPYTASFVHEGSKGITNLNGTIAYNQIKEKTKSAYI